MPPTILGYRSHPPVILAAVHQVDDGYPQHIRIIMLQIQDDAGEIRRGGHLQVIPHRHTAWIRIRPLIKRGIKSKHMPFLREEGIRSDQGGGITHRVREEGPSL
jgi:hypothetical protein